MSMKMSLVVEGLRSDALAVAELGDDTVAEVAERIAAILVRSAPSRLFEALSEVAAELSSELPEGRVDLRMTGDDVSLAYVGEPPPLAGPDAQLTERITLRLSEGLKRKVEEHAAGVGVSVNAWVLRALERGTATGTTTAVDTGHRGPSRLRGYGIS